MLMANDAQLEPITTPFGTVNFVQVWFICFLSTAVQYGVQESYVEEFSSDSVVSVFAVVRARIEQISVVHFP